MTASSFSLTVRYLGALSLFLSPGQDLIAHVGVKCTLQAISISWFDTPNSSVPFPSRPSFEVRHSLVL